MRIERGKYSCEYAPGFGPALQVSDESLVERPRLWPRARGPPPTPQAYEISNLAKDFQIYERFKISRKISRFPKNFTFPERFLDFLIGLWDFLGKSLPAVFSGFQHATGFLGIRLDFGNGFQVVYCSYAVLCAIHSTLLGASAGGLAEGCLEPQYLGEEWYRTFSANRLSFIPSHSLGHVYAVNSPQSWLGLASYSAYLHIAVEVAIDMNV